MELEERSPQPIHESESHLCRTLWVSVALQAVVDARSESPKPELKRAKEEALEWLTAKGGEDSDFASVCDLAGIDFEKTRARLLEVVEDKDKAADFRCIKKALLDNRGQELRSKYLKRIKRQEKARLHQRTKRSKNAPQFQ